MHARALMELLDGGPAHGRIEPAGGREDRVVDRLGVEAPPVHPPEQAVVAVELRGPGIVPHGLTVHRTGDDQPVHLLERSPILEEPRGQPVEQLGMAGGRSHAAEVVRRIHDPAAKMVVPEPVHDRAVRERVARVAQPFRQRGTAGTLVSRICPARTGREATEHSARLPGTAALPGIVDVAALKDINGPRARRGLVGTVRGEVAGGRVDQMRGR